MRTFAERVKYVREERKLSQAELARGINVTRNAVSLWENGSSKSMTPENLFAAADFLRVSARWLATGTGAIYLENDDWPDWGLADLFRMYPDLDRRNGERRKALDRRKNGH